MRGGEDRGRKKKRGKRGERRGDRKKGGRKLKRGDTERK